MEIIDRYIYAVTQSLPENIREDVSEELRSNIQDMLPEDASEEHIKKVLEELGNPAKLAVEYNPEKRYLIGPGLYNRYITLLKLITGIAALAMGGVALLTWLLEPGNGESLTNLIKDVISAVLDGAMQGAFWVTLIFIILERSGVQEGHSPFAKKKWTVEELPDIKDYGKKKISRASTIVEILFTIIVTVVLVFRPSIIGVSLNGSPFVPMLNADRLNTYIIGIVLLGLICLGILVWKTIYPYWSIPLAAANAGCNIAICILMLFMVRDRQMVNSEFLTILEGLTNMTLSQVTLLWQKFLWLFAAGFIVIAICDSMAGVFKCKR
ncbi:hypothetical protein [Ruminiclostridium josui]|uniref:hypothetical protein n=1 Tax=Ruminiclostridium josui TaxID=1499 RepID=UPI0004676922|nr:hypothetical protein [Ruminiclostridium josui]